METDPSPNHHLNFPRASQRGKGTEKTSKKVPGGSSKSAFHLNCFILQPWTDLGPKEPQGLIVEAFLIKVGSCFEASYTFLSIVFQLFSASLHSYRWSGCATAPMPTKLQTKTAAKSANNDLILPMASAEGKWIKIFQYLC